MTVSNNSQKVELFVKKSVADYTKSLKEAVVSFNAHYKATEEKIANGSKLTKHRINL